MFVEARTVPAGTTIDSDLCIVGAGAAGITIAREIIGSRLRVAILESGGLEIEDATQSLEKGANIGLPYFPLDSARLRFFGGTTNHWGGVCRPFDDTDFAARDWVPRSGWPITRDEIAPFYERAWPIVHLTSGEWGLDEWRRRDRFEPLDVRTDRVVTRPAQVVRPSVRSFGNAYASQLRRASNVTVYLHTNVVEVVADDAIRSVQRVHVATLDGNHFDVTARAFVLATGAIENARILLLSNRQNTNGLGNDHDLVGRHFLEHPRFVAGTLVPRTDVGMRFYEQHAVGRARLQGYLALPRPVQRAEQLVDVQIRLEPVYGKRFAAALDSTDVKSARALARELKHGSVSSDLAGHIADVLDDLTTWRRVTIPGAPLPIPYPEVASRLRTADPTELRALVPEALGDIAAVTSRELSGRAPLDSVQVVTRIEPVPNPDSRIALIDERDALGLRKVSLDWRLSTLDRHSVRRTLELFGAELGRAGLGRLRITFDEQGTSWPEDLAGGWHHMGTTRMHDDARSGVVDRDGRVHGISNLFIAGSSVFPTAGSGTPTLLIVALALRMAGLLKESLG